MSGLSSIYLENHVKVKLLIASLAVIVLTGCVNKDNIDNAKPAQEKTVQATHGKILAGGWSQSEVTPEAKLALDTVLKQWNNASKLEKIITVKTQIVAGVNYKIDFQLENGEVWNTVVFKNLNNEYLMTKAATLVSEK